MAAAESVRRRWVTVYCTSWCPHSRRAKALLAQDQIAYEDIDIERDETAAKRVEGWNGGYRSVPTIVVRRILTEPSNAELERILRESGGLVLDLTAYVTSWCPDCRRTLAWLRENQVAAATIDIDEDAEAAQKVQEWNRGMRSVPTLDVTVRLTEPATEQLRMALGLER